MAGLHIERGRVSYRKGLGFIFKMACLVQQVGLFSWKRGLREAAVGGDYELGRLFSGSGKLRGIVKIERKKGLCEAFFAHNRWFVRLKEGRRTLVSDPQRGCFVPDCPVARGLILVIFHYLAADGRLDREAKEGDDDFKLCGIDEHGCPLMGISNPRFLRYRKALIAQTDLLFSLLDQYLLFGMDENGYLCTLINSRLTNHVEHYEQKNFADRTAPDMQHHRG